MKKGSITVYLSLVLCVIVALIYAAIDSARYSCGRALLSMAAEEGLFSLFSEYDRILYEEYGLLVLDGGYDGTELKAGVLLEEAVDYMKKTAMQEGALSGMYSSDLFRINLSQKAVTGYVLATDSGSEPLRAQIHDLMIRKTGMGVLGLLFAKYSGASELLGTATSGEENQMDRLKEEYERQIKNAAQKQEEEETSDYGEKNEQATEINKDEGQALQTPANLDNPIDTVFGLRKLGILSWAVPDSSSVSAKGINRSVLPSGRNLHDGMGVLPKNSASVEDRFLLAKYITDYFPCFTNEKGKGAQYQAEYAIAQKSSDDDNLKSVLTRLLLVREALNTAYLSADPQKQSQVYAAAATISSAFLIPEFTELVKTVLILCWAFGESMLDIKTLLKGGKIPLMKDASTWQLSLDALAVLNADSLAKGNQTGFDYRDYLCLLLMLQDNGSLMSAITDLLEYNRRLLSGEEGFSIDTCICSMEVRIIGSIGNHEVSLSRRYGYET